MSELESRVCEEICRGYCSLVSDKEKRWKVESVKKDVGVFVL